MSSYVTSPFVLEERRLQGIVQQCSMDLNNALIDVEMQLQSMAAHEQERKEKDENYREQMDMESYRFSLSKRAEQEKKQQQRAQIESTLEEIKLEIEIFSKHYGCLESAAIRQQKLEYMLSHAGGVYTKLEKDVQKHLHATEEEMQAMASSQSLITVRHEVSVAKTKLGKKGVSLKEGTAETKNSSEKKSPAVLFDEKLEAALQSRHVQKISKIKELKREYDSQPEYAKTAFAIKNMYKLDECLKRLSRLEMQGKAAKSQWNKEVLEYQAICRLLEIDPLEELISDQRSAPKLKQELKRLKYRYQERKTREYISHSVKVVLEKHGIMFQDADEESLLFSMEGAQVSVVNMGTDLLSMEVVGEYSGDAPTINERRKTVTTAEHFCEMVPVIETELREDYGIIFGKVSTEQPNEEKIVMRRKVKHSVKKTHESKKSMSI